MTDNPSERCRFSWCEQHSETDKYVRHLADVGTVDLVDKDWPLQVRVACVDNKDATGSTTPFLTPYVSVRWDEPPEYDPTPENLGTNVGLDLDGLDALMLAELLTRAVRLLADGASQS
ncbi:hypothetical protein GCM10009527_009180 [Actinomadura nitritigenes]|uniref:Uncharacterized protein n=1 Tax=Actinomadura nitritigenes TaxID=134602 RepID=A0ABS3R0M5_9ACTN|nr:hypothetical protein [Actinomadura nitritigenes]MBO2439797.1 hypothetical protein [Actinomadura nitritigenes]